MAPARLGALSALMAVLLFSINDVSIKFLSGGYALHQVVLIRSVIGLAVLMAVIIPLLGQTQVWRTKRLGLHLVRGLCVVVANMAFFLGLAAMPLAAAMAIFFVSPLVITVFSVIFLGETVGRYRWAATIVGFIGVLIVMRPGTASFQLASLLPLFAAVSYASLHMLTRYIGRTESAVTMTFYIQVTFILVCVVVGLAVGDGRFGEQSDPSLRFLLRGWEWPAWADAPVFIIVGIGVAFGGFFISQAYRVAEAALVAPFEYIALPLSVLWGILIFGEWPDLITYLGILLILVAGLLTVWRENRSDETDIPDSPRLRR